MLIILSRIKKRKPRVLYSEKTRQRDALLEVILQSAVEIPDSCSFYERRKVRYLKSDGSSRYTECVASNQSHYDTGVLSPKQLLRVASQYSKLKQEIEALEKERRELDIKIERLRKQKKIQQEKIIRALRRGITNLKELDQIEREEAAKEKRRHIVEAILGPSDLPIPSDNFINSQDNTFPEVDLDPSVLA